MPGCANDLRPVGEPSTDRVASSAKSPVRPREGGAVTCLLPTVLGRRRRRQGRVLVLVLRRRARGRVQREGGLSFVSPLGRSAVLVGASARTKHTNACPRSPPYTNTPARVVARTGRRGVGLRGPAAGSRRRPRAARVQPVAQSPGHPRGCEHSDRPHHCQSVWHWPYWLTYSEHASNAACCVRGGAGQNSASANSSRCC